MAKGNLQSPFIKGEPMGSSTLGDVPPKSGKSASPTGVGKSMKAPKVKSSPRMGGVRLGNHK